MQLIIDGTFPRGLLLWLQESCRLKKKCRKTFWRNFAPLTPLISYLIHNDGETASTGASTAFAFAQASIIYDMNYVIQVLDLIALSSTFRLTFVTSLALLCFTDTSVTTVDSSDLWIMNDL